MKKLSIILFMTCLGQFALADEPPCWCEFSVTSENGLYRADIAFDKADSKKDPWERKWTLQVFEMKPDTNMLWSTEFSHDGYGDGTLSDDGQIYVYINFWLAMENPPNQIVIYSMGKTKKLSGKDLKLTPSNYPYTDSHQIWFEEYKLSPNYLSDSTYLNITTNDRRNIRVHFKSGEIENSKSAPKFTNENNLLLNYAIGILIFIGVGIAALMLNSRKSARQGV